MATNNVLIERGNKTVKRSSWSGSNTQISKTVDYEAYIDLNYIERFIDRFNKNTEYCVRSAAFSKHGKSKAGPGTVLCTGNKKLQPGLKPLGKPTIIMQATFAEAEQLIIKHFGQRYDILAGEGDGLKAFRVDRDGEADYNAVSQWKITGNGSHLLGSLLTVMVVEGIVSQGTYLVTRS